MVDARRLPDPDWNALCHVSCSALLGGEPRERFSPYRLDRRVEFVALLKLIDEAVGYRLLH